MSSKMILGLTIFNAVLGVCALVAWMNTEEPTNTDKSTEVASQTSNEDNDQNQCFEIDVVPLEDESTITLNFDDNGVVVTEYTNDNYPLQGSHPFSSFTHTDCFH